MNLRTLARSATWQARSWLAGQLIPKSWTINYWQKGADPLRTGPNSVVEACIQAYAQTLAMCPIKHTRPDGKGGREDVPNSPIVALFKKPNAYQTRSDLILNLVCSLFGRGNAYLYTGVRPRIGALPSELHLLNPYVTRGYHIEGEVFYGISTDPWTTLSEARANVSDTVPARDVAHFKLHTPNDFLVGATPIEAAAAAIAVNESITESNAHFYKNRSRGSGLLATDKNYKAAQLDEIRAAWEKQSAGINAGKVPVLGGGLKWQSMAISHEDAQTMETLGWSVQDISRCFRVPLPIINVMEGATFSNAESLINFWISTGLGFVMTHLELVMQNALPLGPDESVDFDESALLRPDFLAMIQALGEATTKGLYTPSEARRKVGLPEVKGGDEPRMQAQMVPLSHAAKELALKETQAQRQQQAPTPPEQASAKELEAMITEELEHVRAA